MPSINIEGHSHINIAISTSLCDWWFGSTNYSGGNRDCDQRGRGERSEHATGL